MSYILKKTRNKNKPNKCNSILLYIFRVKFKQEIQLKKVADQKFIIFQFDAKFLRSYFKYFLNVNFLF